ncbi:glycosyltransferase family 2 protein [Vibrio sp. WXL210]|uniref:glycosyltransferase family 2 protein n=1 Tax=Vibrio sp. WXL210 TaxID=3450709 RepID=UPI003EC5BD5A
MRVKLIAIAKDEGAYLHEWLAYHLSLGFDEIEVFVNNTSDGSYELLSLLSRENEKIKYSQADYIIDGKFITNDSLISRGYLKRNPLQSRIYSQALVENFNKFDYLMFLDIDEFFISSSDSVHDFLYKLGDYDVISIGYMNHSGQEKAFSPPISEELNVSPGRDYKSIVKVPNKLENIVVDSSHNFLVREGKWFRMGKGEVSSRQEALSKEYATKSDFILHHTMRSVDEYLALALRGDTMLNSSLGLKKSRNGWFLDAEYTIDLRASVIDSYEEQLKKLVSNDCIRDCISNSRQTVMSKASKAREVINSIMEEHKIVKKITRGVING